MSPAGILFEEIAPNSSSPAFRASQIRRVFTATKLPSLPATLRELWYRVLVSGFVMGENKAKGDARYCGHCEGTHLTSSDRHFESIAHTFALCPLDVRLGSCSLMVVLTYRGDSGVFTIEFGPGGDPRFRDPASPPPPGSVFANQTSFAHLQEPWDFLRCCVLRILSNERNRICLLPPPPFVWPEWTPTQRLQLIAPPALQPSHAKFCYTSKQQILHDPAASRSP